jgi:putative transposase
LRKECLNAHWFLSLNDAKRKIDQWRIDHNETRPHSALQWATPVEFACCSRQLPAATGPKEPEVSISEQC